MARRMAASAALTFQNDDVDHDDHDADHEELEIASKHAEITISSSPLSIPKPSLELSDLAMSVDTVASSVTEASAASSVTSSIAVQAVNVPEAADPDLPIYSMSEVKDHYETSDAWMVLYDRVYDVTKFLHEVCRSFVDICRPAL